MPNVAGCKLGPIGNGDSRNQGVAKVDGPPDTLARRRNPSCGRCCSFIKGQNLVLNVDC